MIHVSKIMNVKPGVLATYIMGDEVAEELKRIFKDGEEYLEMHSYGHYLIDLKLTRKSPYSALMNPHLHH